jgi:glucokinase
VPARACLAVAAPLRAETVRMTNLNWTFTADSLRAASGIDDLRLINDFEAQARVLPHLAAAICTASAAARPRRTCPRWFSGPGTGLGMAGSFMDTRAGFRSPARADMSASRPKPTRRLAIFRRMAPNSAWRVSAERLIAGPGLEEVYRILAELRGAAQAGHIADIFALRGSRTDPVASETARLFRQWLGRFAGDMALAYGAAGGVYIAGGIAPRILDLLETGPSGSPSATRVACPVSWRRCPASGGHRRRCRAARRRAGAVSGLRHRPLGVTPRARHGAGCSGAPSARTPG